MSGSTDEREVSFYGSGRFVSFGPPIGAHSQSKHRVCFSVVSFAVAHHSSRERGDPDDLPGRPDQPQESPGGPGAGRFARSGEPFQFGAFGRRAATRGSGARVDQRPPGDFGRGPYWQP